MFRLSSRITGNPLILEAVGPCLLLNLEKLRFSTAELGGGQGKSALREKGSNPAMTIPSRRYLLPFKEVAKYLGFAKDVADSKGFRGIKPKYLTTVPPWRDGISKRYRLEETAITSFDWLPI